MKNFFTFLLLCISLGVYAQSGINTKNANGHTFLHVDESGQSTKIFKGVLIARYSTVDRNNTFGALGVADNGLLIYNTTENCFNYWKFTGGAGSWISLCGCTPYVAPLLYYADCGSAISTPASLTSGSNQSGTVTVPITVVTSGTINAINTIINGVNFNMAATALNNGTTSLTINFSGTPISAMTIKLPIKDNYGLTICNVSIPVN